MTVTLVYDAGMPKYINVQLRGVERPAHVRADEVETKLDSDGDTLILLVEKNRVAKFEAGSFLGWWIQDGKD